MDIETMKKFGADVGEEVVVSQSETAKRTKTEISASPEVARNIIANDALVSFAHAGYRGLRALATKLGFRIDEAALTVVVLNLLYAAIQDATIEAAANNPDASLLTIQRHARDLRKRFAGALRAWMRDDKQPEMEAWIDQLTDAQLTTWRDLAAASRAKAAAEETCAP